MSQKSEKKEIEELTAQVAALSKRLTTLEETVVSMKLKLAKKWV
jgi:hypothetical protein